MKESHIVIGLLQLVALGRLLSAALVAAALISTTVFAQEGGAVLVTADRLIDGLGNLNEPGAVLIEGEVITAIGDDARNAVAARTIELGDVTLLPGLIDLHTHLTDAVESYWEEVLVTTTPPQAALHGAANARITLLAGFTTVRDMGPAWAFTDVDLRDVIDQGALPGPRMLVAGNYVSATGGAGDARQFSIYVDVPTAQNLADGPDEVRKVVRTNLKNGADFIKILATGAVLSKGISPGAQQYSDEELEVAVLEAGRWDRFVASHAHGAEGIKASIRAGVRTVDHGSMMDEEGLTMLLDSEFTYYVPTLYVGVIVPRNGASLGIPQEQIDRSTEMMRYRNATFRRAIEAGLTVGFGTDAGVFEHGDNAREFQLRVENGQSAMDVITSATSVNATIIGWQDRVGSVESGKFADLIAVPGNPLDDISLMEQVVWVMKGGEVVTMDARW